MPTATSKVCFKCERDLPITEFYTHPQMADGRLNKCKDCARSDARRRYRHKIEHDPVWREQERERNRLRYGRGGGWSSPTTRQRAAHTAVNNAIRDGKLIPADACEDCGHDFSEFRREAHHDDYDKPLDVRWLCALCHGKQHRLEASG